MIFCVERFFSDKKFSGENSGFFLTCLEKKFFWENNFFLQLFGIFCFGERKKKCDFFFDEPSFFGHYCNFCLLSIVATVTTVTTVISVTAVTSVTTVT